MGNVHKLKAIDLKGDPYIGVCQSSIGNTWVPVHMNKTIVKGRQQGIEDNASR